MIARKIYAEWLPSSFRIMQGMDPKFWRTSKSLICLIALSSIAAAQPSIFQKPIEPDYGDLQPPITTESAQVIITATSDGTPVAMKADKGLPDALVRAILDARFVPGKDNALYRVTLNVQRGSKEDVSLIRAEVADSRVKSFTSDVESAANWDADDFLMQNENLGEDANSDEDVLRRFAILFYAASREPGVAEEQLIKIRRKHLTWLLDHVPTHPLLTFPYSALNRSAGMLADAEGFDLLKDKWTNAAQDRMDVDALLIMANGLRIDDPEVVLARISEFPTDTPKLRYLKGEIYADLVMGAAGRDLISGLPSVFDDQRSASESAQNARATILDQTDEVFLLAAMRRLREDARAAVNQNGLPDHYKDFCKDLSNKVRKVRPEKWVDCSPDRDKDAGPRPPKVVPANLINRVQPEYPGSAKARGIAGTVTFRALISADGEIADLQMISGPLDLFESARKAVSQWRYNPTRLNGVPVRVLTEIQVNFEFR